MERNKCVEKIKACKQKLSEKKYENIITKKKHVKKLIIFLFVNAGHFVNVKGKELLQLNHPYML
jgi:hypothetical protein